MIRAFRDSYPLDASPDLLDVVRGNVDFYAHVVLKWGIQMKLWEKVGNVPFTGKLEALFRASNDYGNPAVKVSHNWRVWKVGEDEFNTSWKTCRGGLSNRRRLVLSWNPPSVVTRAYEQGSMILHILGTLESRISTTIQFGCIRSHLLRRLDPQ